MKCKYENTSNDYVIDHENENIVSDYKDNPSSIHTNSSILEKSYEYSKKIKCPFCNKYFSQKAGERHIAVCD